MLLAGTLFVLFLGLLVVGGVVANVYLHSHRVLDVVKVEVPIRPSSHANDLHDVIFRRL